MFVSGFMGSPRKKGNTNFLLKLLLKNLEKHGAKTEFIDVSEKEILPCTGCALCEKKGICMFEDDMQKEILPIFRKSDIIIIASPIYFYNAPSKLKALIDRSQTLWARKYKLNITDPSEISRKGYMLAVGATKGENLFDSINLTLKYFFYGIGADFVGQLTYNRIEEPGDMEKHESVINDVEKEASKLAKSFHKKTILFTCSNNTGRSQMAGAFARHIAGGDYNILTAGSMPAEKIEPEVELAMAEKGLDIGFRKPESIETITSDIHPDYVVSINSGEETCINIPGSQAHIWHIENTSGKSATAIFKIRDEIEEKVKTFFSEII